MALSDSLSTNILEKEDTARQLGAAGSEQSILAIVSPNVFEPVHAYTITSTRCLGSSFILGLSPNTNPGGAGAGGILGSVVASGINFLGDSRCSFTVVGVSSPDNIFVETFVGSRFKDSVNTTAQWTNTGSCSI